VRHRDVYLAATGTWLPRRTSVREAVDAGLVGEYHRDLGYETVTVADDTCGAELALKAARIALGRCPIPAEEFGLVLHASSWFQGLDWWPAAAYVADRSVGAHPVAFDLQQRSNGAMGALHLAAAALDSGAASTALITTGDNFAGPHIDRWGTMIYTLLGDGGTAAVLSTIGGFARLRSTALYADNSLEPWSRGAETFTLAPGQVAPVPVMRRFHEHSQTPRAAGSWERLAAVMAKARDEALADAGIGPGDVARVVTPFNHRGNGQQENYDALGFTVDRSAWEFGRTVGHLGAGDQFAGLDHLVGQRAVGVGDFVLLVGAGVGYTTSAAVVEIVADPPR
jgi:3-oxoacyl-[acyl-carrier-protein] synthase III